MTTSSSFSSKTYLSIEGLRGILALTVCFGHFGFERLLEPLGLLFNIHYAVDLFFVISGVVLAKSNYYSNIKLTGYHFFVKRIARLYPLHLLTLIFVYIVNSLQGKPNPSGAFFENLFVIHNLGLFSADRSFNFPSWSISVELWCGLLLFYITQWLKPKIAVSCFLMIVLFFCFFFSSALIVGEYDAIVGEVFNAGLLRCLAGTSLGIVIFLVSQAIMKYFFTSYFIAYFALLGLLLFFFFNPPYYGSFFFYLFAFLLIGSLLHSSFFRILSLRPFVFLGKLSYSLYLLHIPIYYALQVNFGNSAVKGLMGKCVLLPILFVSAIFIYYFFELPMQKFLKEKFTQPFLDVSARIFTK